MSVCWLGGHGRISGGTRVLELAAESREAALGYGARSTSTSMLTQSRPKWGITTPTTRRTIATGGAAGLGGGVFFRINAVGKPDTEGLNNIRTPAAFLDPGISTVHYSNATHYR
jgi:hypothetical protein